ncbi:MAG TPA: ATP-binding protein [Jatrophihabitans sp.]
MDSNQTHSESAEHASQPIEIPLPADVRAPGEARGFVRERLPELGEDVLDDVTLIVSELVSNAVQHGQPDIVLRMIVEPLSIDVSVLDHGTTVPSRDVQVPMETATSGRGLSIVDRLASDWGVLPLEPGRGKHVWARLKVGD